MAQTLGLAWLSGQSWNWEKKGKSGLGGHCSASEFLSENVSQLWVGPVLEPSRQGRRFEVLKMLFEKAGPWLL